jgi:hypothetical protein
MKDEAFGLRDLAKSMMSCTWAMSVFGMRQMISLLSPSGDSRAKNLAQAVDKVTDAATTTFDDSSQTVYRVGTTIQNAVIDVTLGGAIFDARKPAKETTTDAEPAPPATVLVSRPFGGQAQSPLSEPERDEDWTLKVQ